MVYKKSTTKDFVHRETEVVDFLCVGFLSVDFLSVDWLIGRFLVHHEGTLHHNFILHRTKNQSLFFV